VTASRGSRCARSRDDLLCSIRYRREIATGNLQTATMYKLADRMTIWQTGVDLSDGVMTAAELHRAGGVTLLEAIQVTSAATSPTDGVRPALRPHLRPWMVRGPNLRRRRGLASEALEIRRRGSHGLWEEGFSDSTRVITTYAALECCRRRCFEAGACAR